MTSGQGQCVVVANQSGNTDYSQATQLTQSVSLTQVAQTITFTTPPPASAVYNSMFTVAATGGASGNAVVFSSEGACTNVGATFTMTSGQGQCVVVADQSGNTDYSQATQLTQSVSLTQVAQTITFTTPPPASAVYNSSFTVAATGGASGNPVVFSSEGACTNVGATFTMTSGQGQCVVVATNPAIPTTRRRLRSPSP